MKTHLILAQTESNKAAALFVNGKVVLTLGDVGTPAKFAARAVKLAQALQAALHYCTLPDPVTENWGWQDMYEEAQRAASDTTSVRVGHVKTYNLATDPAETHQLDIVDQRQGRGQVRLVLGALEGKTDDLLEVAVEVGTNPFDTNEAVPCAHVHLDTDEPVVSLYKLGDRILVRPNADVDVTVDHAQGEPRRLARETVIWLK
jgi:hypothetical protein